jgi:putative transposase
MPTKRTTQTAATRPMTGAEAFEAGRRAYEAAAAGSTGAAAPTAAPQRAPVTTRAATLTLRRVKKDEFVLQIILSFLVAMRVFWRSRSDTALEVLAVRQQVAGLKRKRPRAKLNSWDRPFWTALRQCWSRSTDVLVLVKPDTVIGWHRAGFRLYCRWRSRPLGGRPKITEEIRVLIRQLAQENQDWGAPKIHGELQNLGLAVSERSVARYLRRMWRRGDPATNWLTFLQNHREVITAFDFFTVPTVTFQLLYCFFVIEHGRRRILHFNVTEHPTAEWVVQQLRAAFPEAGPYRYAIFD